MSSVRRTGTDLQPLPLSIPITQPDFRAGSGGRRSVVSARLIERPVRSSRVATPGEHFTQFRSVWWWESFRRRCWWSTGPGPHSGILESSGESARCRENAALSAATGMPPCCARTNSSMSPGHMPAVGRALRGPMVCPAARRARRGCVWLRHPGLPRTLRRIMKHRRIRGRVCRDQLTSSSSSFGGWMNCSPTDRWRSASGWAARFSGAGRSLGRDVQILQGLGSPLPGTLRSVPTHGSGPISAAAGPRPTTPRSFCT